MGQFNRCPHFKGRLYTQATFGTPESVLIIEVTLLQCARFNFIIIIKAVVCCLWTKLVLQAKVLPIGGSVKPFIIGTALVTRD